MLRLPRPALASRSPVACLGAPHAGLVWVVLMACGAELTISADGPATSQLLAGDPEQAGVTLEGAGEVRVERLGTVDGPRVLRADGTEVVGVRWSVSPPEVAEMSDGVLFARAPGTATVSARFQEQAVSWTLVVDPAVGLQFVDPPVALSVGEAVTLQVAPRRGDAPVEVAALGWTSSDEAVLDVAGGRAVGVGPGTAWITVEGRNGSRAILQLHVRE